jgi:SAM-dependent methyltransferase
MPENSSVYRGLRAASWDLLRGDTSGWPDRPFYRGLIEHSGEPALDVGCGTGRLLLDYLAEGIDIEGVDNSPEMLGTCRPKAAALGLQPVLYAQALERLALPRTYRTILIPSSTFQLVVDAGAATEALRCLYRHLAPAGTLVLSLMALSGPEALGAWVLVQHAVRPADGLLVRRWRRTAFNPVTELETSEDRYELLDGARIVATELHRRSPAVRSYRQGRVMEMLREAGFVSVRLVSGFTEAPARPSDTVFCAFGHRPRP